MFDSCKVVNHLSSTQREIPGFEHKHLQVVLDCSNPESGCRRVWAAIPGELGDCVRTFGPAREAARQASRYRVISPSREIIRYWDPEQPPATRRSTLN